MTIARGVKYGALIALFIVAYVFMGAMTYRYHESLYPGSDSVMTCSDDPNNGSVELGVFWPIGLPVTLGLHAARLVK